MANSQNNQLDVQKLLDLNQTDIPEATFDDPLNFGGVGSGTNFAVLEALNFLGTPVQAETDTQQKLEKKSKKKKNPKTVEEVLTEVQESAAPEENNPEGVKEYNDSEFDYDSEEELSESGRQRKKREYVCQIEDCAKLFTD